MFLVPQVILRGCNFENHWQEEGESHRLWKVEATSDLPFPPKAEPRRGGGRWTSIREAGETHCRDSDHLGFLPAGACGWTDTGCGKTRGSGTPQEPRLSGRPENASGEFAGSQPAPTAPRGAGGAQRAARAGAEPEARDWAVAPAPLGLGGGDSEGGGRGAAGRAGGPRRKAQAAPQPPAARRGGLCEGGGGGRAGAARPREGAFERFFVSRPAQPQAWAPACRS